MATCTCAPSQLMGTYDLYGEIRCRRCDKSAEPEASRPTNPIRADHVVLVTSETIPGCEIIESRGLAFSARSHTAWKANTQKGRLVTALEGAMIGLRMSAAELGANGVIAIKLAANSSEGSSAMFGGSSDAIVLMGTAVVVRKLPKSEFDETDPVTTDDLDMGAQRDAEVLRGAAGEDDDEVLRSATGVG
jgi:uncharacterized protein YbjQ (UPF0145 family)